MTPSQISALTPAQLAALEKEAAILDAENALREINNLIAAIGGAFSKEGGRELERWREKLLNLIT